MNTPWGNKCFMCGEAPKPGTEVYGLIGPLTCVKEQNMVCDGCVAFMKKYRVKCC